MDVLYFIKEHLCMSAKPSWTLKTKCYHSCGCCDDSQSREQLKKHVTDKYFEKKRVRSWAMITFCYRKCMLLLQYLSDWCLNGICFTEIPGGKTCQIEWLFESHLRSFGCFECPAALRLFLDPSCKGNFWVGASGPDYHLVPKMGHLQIMNPRYDPDMVFFLKLRSLVLHLTY